MFETLRQSPAFRLTLIGILSLLLLIPAFMVENLVEERQSYRRAVISEVSEKWGRSQVLTGLVLTIPYIVKRTPKDSVATIETYYMHFLPDTLNINGTVAPEIRSRGIYQAILYNGKLNFSGSFSLGELSELRVPEKDILWNNAFVSFGITDMTGIKDMIRVKWDGAEYQVKPGIETDDVLSSGVSAKVPVATLMPPSEADKKAGRNFSSAQLKPAYNFSLDLNLNGSEALRFIPVGKETNVSINSTWNTPKFSGSFLPDARNVTNEGFTASWKVLHLNRNFPQQWIGSAYYVDNSPTTTSARYEKYNVYPEQAASVSRASMTAYNFGVEFIIGADDYQQTMRSIKYALMFIGLTFISLFMIELLTRKMLHPIQYLLIGIGLVLFYTLLLSFSEQLRFGLAYLIASSAMTLLIAGYTKAVLADIKLTAIVVGILSLLYGFLYVVLQLESYSLLLGSVGLFIVLALVMYLTRNINWYTLGKKPAA
jgi:inner membrane protein